MVYQVSVWFFKNKRHADEVIACMIVVSSKLYYSVSIDDVM